jgi:hypothetical protein
MIRTTVDTQATVAPVDGASRLGSWSATAAFGSHHAVASKPMPIAYVVKTNGNRRRPLEDSN